MWPKPGWDDKKGWDDLKTKALEWAKGQLIELKKKGWKQAEIEHHILAELGRNASISVASYVEKMLKIHMVDCFGEEPGEDGGFNLEASLLDAVAEGE